MRPVGSLFNKLVFATRFQDSNILLSDRVNPESRILWDRDPRERIAKVAPWLSLDGDPYPVVVNGRIVWIMDGYTTSNQYPNAARTSLTDATSDSITTRTGGSIAPTRERINYMRNSVKATVDAYDGTVTLYAWDPSDPVLAAWRSAFPDLFVDAAQMPEELMAHVRYPEDMFKVQRTIFSRYHVAGRLGVLLGPGLLDHPQRPDPADRRRAAAAVLPHAADAGHRHAPSFSLTTAFSPSRQTDAGRLHGGGQRPGGGLRQDPCAPAAAKHHDPGADPGAEQLRVRSSGRSAAVAAAPGRFRRGARQPAEPAHRGGMLYVEPVYVQAVGDQGFPLLRKVLVGYGPRVAMEDTLLRGTGQVFVGAATGGGETPPPADGSDPQAELTQALLDAQQAFTDGETALAAGDFAAYGEAQQRLKEALDRAAQAQARITGDATLEPAAPVPADDSASTA